MQAINLNSFTTWPKQMAQVPIAQLLVVGLGQAARAEWLMDSNGSTSCERIMGKQ